MVNRSGLVFGDLTVLNFCGKRDRKYYWHCRCRCGNETDVAWNNLQSGNSRSCGRCNKYICDGDISILITKNDNYCFVDSEKVPELRRYVWSCNAARNEFSSTIDGHLIKLHRYLLGVKDPHIFVDHIDGDVLDNRLCNLRICTPQQNAQNSNIMSNNTSGFKGVSWDKRRKKYEAYIWCNYKKIHIGYFDSKIKAALAYNEMAKKLFGEFCCLNPVGYVNANGIIERGVYIE